MNEPPASTTASDANPGDDAGEVVRHVVVYASPDDPRAFGEHLVEKLGMHPTDAQIQARAVPGLLPGRFTPEQADEVLRAVQELGLSAEILTDADIPELDAAKAIHHARCDEGGLEIVDSRDRVERRFGWNDVRLLSVGYVPLEVDHRYPTDPTGMLTSGRRTWVSSLEISSLSGPEAWLICGSEDHAYRIDHNLMNYEYLGDRKTGSATRNFRMFIEDVADGATRAYRTPAARAYLDHGLLRHYEFRSSDELQRYTQFHILLAHRLRES